MSGRHEFGDLVPAGLSDSARVEHTIKVIEPPSQLGSLQLQHLHIRDRAALVVVHGRHVAVGRHVVGGLDPERVAPDLAEPGIGTNLVGALALH